MRRWTRGNRETTPQDAGQPHAVRPTPLHLVQGDSYSGWEAIYLDNVHRIYRLMFAKVGNRPDAEDLTAEVFLTALRPLRVSATVGEVRAYLLMTARTVLAGHWRRTLGREITTIDVDHAAAGPPDPPAPAAGHADLRLERILSALSERHREILELRFLRSYSIRETAAEMGISIGNTKVLQHRALRSAADAARDIPPDPQMGERG